jgi:hypothetical protein
MGRNTESGTSSNTFGRRFGRAGYGLTAVELAAMRVRFQATPAAPDLVSLYEAAVQSSLDVPLLIAEVERLALKYANLVAACRAGLLDALENGEAPEWSDAWRYIIDELPPVPETHPLSCRPLDPPDTGGEA